MKFVRTKENGEKLYVEATEHRDIAYYKESPRWEPCSDEEWEKAMKPAAEIEDVKAEEISDIPEDVKIEEPVLEDEIEELDVE